jgi:hypothetical protein
VNIGGVKVPDFVLKTVTRELEDKLIGPIEQAGNYVLDPTSLSVNGGIFTVRGQIIY